MLPPPHLLPPSPLAPMSDALPSPPPSPPPSAPAVSLPQDAPPRYTRRCTGCAQELFWCRWMVRDGDLGRWYTFCDMGEPGCSWFQWAFDGNDHIDLTLPSPTIQLTPPQTSGRRWFDPSPPTTPHRTEDSEDSLSSPALHRRTSPALAERRMQPASSSSASHRRTPSVGLSRFAGQVKPLLVARQRNRHRSHCLPSASEHRMQPASTSDLRTPSSPRIWPNDFYADEMDLGFRKCRREFNRHRSVEQVFQSHFHAKFVRSTFYMHRQHWESVDKAVRERYIRYGRTEKGRWSTFVRREIKGETDTDDLY